MGLPGWGCRVRDWGGWESWVGVVELGLLIGWSSWYLGLLGWGRWWVRAHGIWGGWVGISGGWGCWGFGWLRVLGGGG